MKNFVYLIFFAINLICYSFELNEKDTKIINDNNYSIYENKEDNLILISKDKKYKMQFCINIFPAKYVNWLKDNKKDYVQILSDIQYHNIDEYLLTQQEFGFLDSKKMKINYIYVIRMRKLEDLNKNMAELCYILEIESDLSDKDYYYVRNSNPKELPDEGANVANALNKKFLVELAERVSNSKNKVKGNYPALIKDFK